MFLHVGNNKNIRTRDVIGIFDMDNTTTSAVTRKFLNTMQKKDLVVSADSEIPRSFILYREGGDLLVCFSQISASALRGRLNSLPE